MKHVDDIEGAGWTVLTARERDVIHPVAEGKSNKLIAMELGISMRTVEAHRARIFYKMGVRNAVQLAREVCTNPEPFNACTPDPAEQCPGLCAQTRVE
jgi:DNA-binding NarL/FixJ family response regulator